MALEYLLTANPASSVIYALDGFSTTIVDTMLGANGHAKGLTTSGSRWWNSDTSVGKVFEYTAGQFGNNLPVNTINSPGNGDPTSMTAHLVSGVDLCIADRDASMDSPAYHMVGATSTVRQSLSLSGITGGKQVFVEWDGNDLLYTGQNNGDIGGWGLMAIRLSGMSETVTEVLLFNYVGAGDNTPGGGGTMWFEGDLYSININTPGRTCRQMDGFTSTVLDSFNFNPSVTNTPRDLTWLPSGVQFVNLVQPGGTHVVGGSAQALPGDGVVGARAAAAKAVALASGAQATSFGPVDLLSVAIIPPVDAVVRLGRPCDWFDPQASAPWAAASAGQDWQGQRAGSSWHDDKAGAGWHDDKVTSGWYDPRRCS